MAEITYISRTSTTITVQLTGLQTDYSTNDRMAYWYVTTESTKPSDIYSYVDSEYLGAYLSAGAEITLTQLSPSTPYYVWCLVQGAGGSAVSGGWDSWFNAIIWTDDEAVSADIELTLYSVFQPTDGDKTLTVYFNVENGIGATYNLRFYNAFYSPEIEGVITDSTTVVYLEAYNFEEQLPVIIEIKSTDGNNTIQKVVYVDVIDSTLSIYKVVSVSDGAYVHIKATGIIEQIDNDLQNNSLYFFKNTELTESYIGGNYITQYSENYRKIYVFFVSNSSDVGQLKNIYVTYNFTHVCTASMIVVPPSDYIGNYDFFTVQTGTNILTITFDKTGNYADVVNCTFRLDLLDGNRDIVETKYINYSETLTFENLNADTYRFQFSTYVLYNNIEYWGSKISGSACSDTSVIYNTPIGHYFVITGNKNWQWYWTSEELYALQNRGQVKILTCDRLNEFATYVDSMLRYKCDAETYAQYKEILDKFTFSENDNTLTAEKFNAIKKCIGSFNSTSDRIPETVYTGEIVYGDYFEALSEKLNGIE